jgi:DNA replication protein DnaC
VIVIGETRIVGLCETCQGAVDAERREAEAQQARRERAGRLRNIDYLLAVAGVPLRWRSCARENFQGRAPAKAPAFITGPVGTGKTHLAVAFLREMLIERGAEAGRFLRVVNLFAEIRECFRRDSATTEMGLLRRYGDQVYFLVLDDLGAEKETEYVEQTLYDLIDRRYGNMLPTLITSNLSLEEIAEHYRNHGDRLVSRIIGMGHVMALSGKDHRVE